MLVFMTVLSACAFAADQAGTVSFVIGDASAVGADGKATALARGDEVQAGQTLVTGATGHVHLHMVDGAFISVRPQSRLRIEEYHYDVALPANNRIKFVLEQGVARSITGRAGEAAKQNYRLNTPLAAIGIRGTDFVVQAGADVTRVTVQSGAIVMSPFGSDCLANALGACKSANSRVLTAAMHDAYLELRNRNGVPLLVPAEKALESPNLLAPPRPEEPKTSADKQSKTSINSDGHDAIVEASADAIKIQVDAAAGSTTPTPPVDSTTGGATGSVTPPAPIPQAKFWWGRWAQFVQPGQENTSMDAVLAADGRKGTFINDVFGLVAETGDVTVPKTGVAKFRLADSEVLIMTDRKTLTPASVSAPSLTIDFGAGRFDTALTVNSAELAPVSIQASGRVTWQGELRSDANTTGTTVNGMLSRDSSQAGYVFQRDMSNNQSVVGATRWYR